MEQAVDRTSGRDDTVVALSERRGRTVSLDRRILRSSGGRGIAYVEAGSGPDLVLIHGALTTLDDMWLGPMTALSRHFRVIAVDRPGHGASDRIRFRDGSPWAQAAIVREALRALGLHRPVIVGHSFGGAVALSYAMSFPDEIAGIVALAPICFPELRLEQLLFGPRAVPVLGDALAFTGGAAFDTAMLPLLWRTMFLPQAMPPRFAAEFPFAWARRPAPMIANGEDAAALWPALTRLAMAYGRCRVPVHILGGDADLVVGNLLHGWNASRLIPGARFDLIAGAGHMLHHFHADAITAAAMEMGRA
ncbi:alpha/beta hydrolase [Methylobacterium sp. Leaf108]|nr:alpha/beta hydrolase [Methylobacterium sp. Leaf108]